MLAWYASTMHKRWANGFTIVEIIITIAVLGIIAAVVVLGYGSIQRSTIESNIETSLYQVGATMNTIVQEAGEYPNTISEDVVTNKQIDLSVVDSGSRQYYGNLTPVQNGVLLSQICQDLITEGVGKGVNQGGDTEDYITGCGNWNDDSMQITGWDTKKYDTPVQSAALLSYADSFTTNDNWNKVHETVVKNFHYAMVERLTLQGGSFPVTVFWDSWATPTNGGVQYQPLPASSASRPYFCVTATHSSAPNDIWHVTQENIVRTGPCP